MSIHETADVSAQAHVADSASIWHYAQVREGATIGDHVIIGRGAYIGPGVCVGRRSKIQNSALIYNPAHLGEGVFIGPGAILTNDEHPRAIKPDGQQKSGAEWSLVGVEVQRGASIGAGAVCVAPLRIGQWAMVAAGAVVVNDVPDFAVVAGVPAQQFGWVGRLGQRLKPSGRPCEWICAKSGDLYAERDGLLLLQSGD